MDKPQALTFRPVTRETWVDFETLFLGRGGPKSCWCMVWRNEPNGPAVETNGASRRVAMTGIFAMGQPIGILSYCNEQPVAWCSIAPRRSMKPGLAAILSGDNKLHTRSLVCFYVQVKWRGKGAFSGLLAAAEIYAQNNGADVIEAYPVEPDSPSYRFGGFTTNFEQAGYLPYGQAGTRRRVMRKSLKVAA